MIWVVLNGEDLASILYLFYGLLEICTEQCAVLDEVVLFSPSYPEQTNKLFYCARAQILPKWN